MKLKVIFAVLTLTVLLSMLTNVGLAEDRNQIVILNASNNSRMKTAITMFREKYPHMEVVLKETSDSRTIGTWMMSKTGEVDIVATIELYLPMTTYQYYSAGAIDDLSQYPVIMQHMEAYRADQFGALMIDDAFLAVPEYLNPTAWKVNDELASEMNISVPQGEWTWSDFAEIGRQIKAYNEVHGTKYYLLLDNLYAPYILKQLNANAADIVAGSSNYSSATYSEGMTAWVEMVQEGLIADRRKNITAVAIFSFDTMLDYGSLRQEHYIIPPAFDSETKYPLSVNALMINANSRHKEEAAYFLSCYFAPENVAVAGLEDIGPWLKDDSQQVSVVTDPSKAVSVANKDLWLALLRRGTMDMGIGEIKREQWNVLYPQLIEGEITVEQFLNSCQHRVNLMLGE